MDYAQLITTILETIVIPAIGIVGVFLVRFLQKKFDEIEQNNANKELQKYINMAENLIIDAVIQTNQTFVEALKADGNFTEEDAALALQKTKEQVLMLLTVTAREVIAEAYGDFDSWLKMKIESSVNQSKTTFVTTSVGSTGVGDPNKTTTTTVEVTQ
jgi:type II secretory pathway pseudopilin PulG